MIYYFGRTYTAARTGTAVRDVHCEKCGCDYRYRLFRRGTGTGTSPYYLNNRGAQRRADNAAEQQLRKLLVFGVDPVACPDCGWFQADMIRELQRRSHRWAVPVAIVMGFLMPIAAFIYWLNVTHDGKRDLTGSDRNILIVMGLVWLVGMVWPS